MADHTQWGNGITAIRYAANAVCEPVCNRREGINNGKRTGNHALSILPDKLRI